MDVVATVERRPVTGETVAGHNVAFFPGGKGANQAVAAKRAGAATALVAQVGDDVFSSVLHTFLADELIDLTYVGTRHSVASGTAIIVVDELGENSIVVIPGANATLTAADIANVPVAEGDILVTQFETPLPTVAAFLNQGVAAQATTVVNCAPAVAGGAEVARAATFIVVNEAELSTYAECSIDTDSKDEYVLDAARTLLGPLTRGVIVTLGARGVVALLDDETAVIPGHTVVAVDTTGAGDCFVGNFAAQLANGASPRDAALFANSAASICVQRNGAGPSMPRRDEVQAAR